MAIRVNARKLFNELGQHWKRYTSLRLKQGVGLFGKLAQKRWPGKQGFRLGYDNTANGVPGRLMFAPVRITRTGFVITVAKALRDHVFHAGRSGERGKPGLRNPTTRRRGRKNQSGKRYYQAPRPFAGFTTEWEAIAARKVVQAIADAGRRGGLFK